MKGEMRRMSRGPRRRRTIIKRQSGSKARAGRKRKFKIKFYRPEILNINSVSSSISCMKK